MEGAAQCHSLRLINANKSFAWDDGNDGWRWWYINDGGWNQFLAVVKSEISCKNFLKYNIGMLHLPTSLYTQAQGRPELSTTSHAILRMSFVSRMVFVSDVVSSVGEDSPSLPNLNRRRRLEFVVKLQVKSTVAPSTSRILNGSAVSVITSEIRAKVL